MWDITITMSQTLSGTDRRPKGVPRSRARAFGVPASREFTQTPQNAHALAYLLFHGIARGGRDGLHDSEHSEQSENAQGLENEQTGGSHSRVEA